MSEQGTIAGFARRIRAGDEQAAAELVRLYEPLIRREVRLRLQDERVRRVFDSMDVCQSVLASFFVRAAAGQYELDEPGQVLRLLVSMARNKAASAARREHTRGRDSRRLDPAGDEALRGVSGDDPSPSTLAAGRELLRRFRMAPSAEERRLADLRGEGLGRAEIAAQVGGTAESRRMQLTRAVDRVAQALGLDEAVHE
jgi:RNA polymerase sigma-70 factor (ECF subfamily)